MDFELTMLDAKTGSSVKIFTDGTLTIVDSDQDIIVLNEQEYIILYQTLKKTLSEIGLEL
jgi:hypothetical protein